MPLITSPYIAKGLFKNPHFSTIYSAKLRPSPKLLQQRERMSLKDKDFLDLDWSFSEKPSNKVAILIHGLEGNAHRTYIKGAGRILKKGGYDVAAINLRGCSGEPNKMYCSYNAGKTDDLDEVIDFILKKDNYTEIALIGFSLGGNLILKYLGEREIVSEIIKKAVVVSTPLSLKGSLESLTKFSNKVYSTSFLYDLKKKYKSKMNQFPEKINPSDLKKIKSLLDFDDIYTAPAHGFKDALDYYKKNSSEQFLPAVKIPVLILNAKNDTFLSKACYPYKLAANSKNIYLETPKYGGHVGFHKTNTLYYSEKRTLAFLNEM